jgi:hypothetical protein
LVFSCWWSKLLQEGDNIVTQQKLPRSVILQAPALLPMLYTVSEISNLLGIPDRTLRDWLAFYGAPHTRDKKNHLWINGVLFAGWVNDLRKKKPKTNTKLATDEAYCLRCSQPVKLTKPVMIPVKGKLVLIQGRCQHRAGMSRNHR